MPTAVVRGGTPVQRTPLIKPVNREHWLQNCVDVLVPHIETIAAQKVPDVLISVSMPTKRGTATRKRIVGQCIPLAKHGKKSHLFIHPQHVELSDVAGTVAHELIHTLAEGHGKEFGRIAGPLMLTRPWTSAGATEQFFALTDKRGRSIREQLLKLGPYPHEALDLTTFRPQKTFLIKAACGKCDMVIRTTQKWIDATGLPRCACGGTFQKEVKRSAAKRKAR